MGSWPRPLTWSKVEEGSKGRGCGQGVTPGQSLFPGLSEAWLQPPEGRAGVMSQEATRWSQDPRTPPPHLWGLKSTCLPAGSLGWGDPLRGSCPGKAFIKSGDWINGGRRRNLEEVSVCLGQLRKGRGEVYLSSEPRALKITRAPE